MIYIIWNKSHEWDDIENSDCIEFITTDYEKAIDFFKEHFGNTKDMDDSKWSYEFEICEYKDGWMRFTNEKKVIEHIDNTNEEE